MKSWWSPVRRRLAVVREAERRGHLGLFVQSFCVAIATPVLLRLPLHSLEALLEWTTAGRPRDASDDPDVVATTVLAMLQVGRPLVPRGCLTRGITLYYALRRAGVDAGLTFGMGRISGGDGFDGHCWLVLGGEPYLEPRDPRCNYATMYSFRSNAVVRDQPASPL